MDASHRPAPRLQAQENPVHRPARVAPAFIDLTASSDNEDWHDADDRPPRAHRPDNNTPRSQRRRSVTPHHHRPAAVNRNMPINVGRHSPEPEIPGSRPHQNPAPNFEPPLPNLQHRPQNPPVPGQAIDLDPDDFWGDYLLDEEPDMEALFRAIDRQPKNSPRSAAELAEPQMASFQPPAAPSSHSAAPIAQEPPAVELRDTCIATVTMVFPGIDPDYVSELYDTVSQSSEQLTAHILDKIEKGSQYPKAKDKKRNLKRKREIDADEEAAKKYGAVDRVIAPGAGGVRPYIRSILMQEFPVTPAAFIDATLNQNHYRLFSAYRILEEAHRTYNSIPPPYNKIKNSRKMDPLLREVAVASFLASPDSDRDKIEVLKELQAARRMKRKADAAREAERQKELDEEENVKKSEAEGTMAECGCCCCDYPLNRMIHCDSSEEMHWFCRGCARMTAEVEIGKSKYELRCMSTDKCEAGFAMDQRVQFLDEKTRVALERNEQEANLRLAGIENLESCPFCPYAAEYPPVEVDREFRCQAEDCERVSCRLCKLDSHIPKSCEEFAKENGLSIRRQIEEAMSEALIRKCNKCGTPFVKEEGCNKMTCTRNGCMNIQCYVCSKSCGYDHFNDPGRGGKAGNCPLFESVEQRHEDEVKKAEKEALDKVLADHPEYTAEDLRVEMSDKVKEDDAKRKAKDPRARADAMMARLGPGRLEPPMPLAADWLAMVGPALRDYQLPDMAQLPGMPRLPDMPQPAVGAYGPFAGIPRPHAPVLGQPPQDPFGAAARLERIQQLRQQLNQAQAGNAGANAVPAPPAIPPVPLIRPRFPPRRDRGQAAREGAIVEAANNRDRERVAAELARADAGRAGNAGNPNANGGLDIFGGAAARPPGAYDDGFDEHMDDIYGDVHEYDMMDEDMADWLDENEGVGGGRVLRHDWF